MSHCCSFEQNAGFLGLNDAELGEEPVIILLYLQGGEHTCALMESNFIKTSVKMSDVQNLKKAWKSRAYLIVVMDIGGIVLYGE